MTPARPAAEPSAGGRRALPFFIFLSLATLPLAGRSEAPKPSAQELRQLVRQLGDDSFDARELATRRLNELGTAALPALEEASASGDPEVQQRAWRLIDQRATEGNVPALLFQLASQSSPIRASAADNLGKMEAKAQVALPGLIKAAGDSTDYVRCSVQEALKKIQATLPVRLEVKNSVESVELNTPALYRIEVTNQGKTAATNVCITAFVPEQMALQGVDGQVPHRVDGAKVLCEPLTLEVNETRSCEIQLKPEAVGSARLRVEVTVNGLAAPILGEATTTINPPAPAPGK